jgi:hypothetical protein
MVKSIRRSDRGRANGGSKRRTKPDLVTYDLGVLFLLGTIRPQHGFSLINSHTSPLDDLKVFQSGYNLAFNPGNQLETDRTFGAYEKVTPTEYSTPSLIVTERQLLKPKVPGQLTY